MHILPNGELLRFRYDLTRKSLTRAFLGQASATKSWSIFKVNFERLSNNLVLQILFNGTFRLGRYDTRTQELYQSVMPLHLLLSW